ncbi:trypsin-7-like isoform X2 [Aricia agestis]|uniref:trypsin-7-like isoform X2 n=1 Tax=Aricia agestis TaxID=91739 RepID=UPI001C20493A|nr:trypsin-7-like isoform X2 [Aricia agestis]
MLLEVVNFKVDIVRTDIESAEPSRRNYEAPEPKPALRIMGGSDADISNHPYVAAILIHDRLWCAGSIVDVDWVLTAAHCLNYVIFVDPMRGLQDYVKVRVGSSKPLEGGKLVDIVGAVSHPKFEEEPVPHADIALLKLAGRLRFSSSVRAIKIFEGFVEPYPQSFVLVCGWGATKSNEDFEEHPPDLLTARLKVRTQTYCEDAYELVSGFRYDNDFFCASLRNGTRDACLFDAGAPAVQQNRLMGVMSFGPKRCGDEIQPPVFIKAYYFRDFVARTIASYKTTREQAEAQINVEYESTFSGNTTMEPEYVREATEEDFGVDDQ